MHLVKVAHHITTLDIRIEDEVWIEQHGIRMICYITRGWFSLLYIVKASSPCYAFLMELDPPSGNRKIVIFLLLHNSYLMRTALTEGFEIYNCF